MSKKTLPFIIIMIVIIVITFALIIIFSQIQNSKTASQIDLNLESIDCIEFPHEPEKIHVMSIKSSKLIVISDGNLYLYDADKSYKRVDLPFVVSDACGYDYWNYMLVTDNHKNLYRVDMGRGSVSDILLTNVISFSSTDVDKGTDSDKDSFGAVTEDGKLYVWGSNAYGQLGIIGKDYIDNPTLVDYIDNVSEIRFDNHFSHYAFLRTKDGDVYETGDCIGDFNKKYCLYQFTKVSELHDIKNIYSGYANIAVDFNDKVYYWNGGFNSNGKNNYESNSEISNLCTRNKIDVFSDCGTTFYCIGLSKVNKKVYYWGYDIINDNINRIEYNVKVPTAINGLKEIDEVYAAYRAAYFKSGNKIYILKY